MHIPVWTFHRRTDSSWSLLNISDIYKTKVKKKENFMVHTLLADTTSDGCSGWVLISFIESPWPTKLCGTQACHREKQEIFINSIYQHYTFIPSIRYNKIVFNEFPPNLKLGKYFNCIWKKVMWEAEVCPIDRVWQ